MTFHCLAHDPVDGVFIFIGIDPDNPHANRTYAYRSKRRSTID